MPYKTFRGRALIGGIAEGEALVFDQALGLVGDIDPISGDVQDARQKIKGMNITNKVLIIRNFRGSTGGSGIFLEAVRNKRGPAAIVAMNSDPVLVAGPVLAKKFYNVQIPLVDNVDAEIFKETMTGDHVYVDGNLGIIKIVTKIRKTAG